MKRRFERRIVGVLVALALTGCHMTVTVEFAAEDRARVDRLLAAFGAPEVPDRNVPGSDDSDADGAPESQTVTKKAKHP